MLVHPIHPLTNSLYEQDLYLWTQQMTVALQTGQLDQLDLINLAEEIASLGRSEKRELRNRLQILLMHLLKWHYQPHQRSHSWQSTITEQRIQISELLQDSPSLVPHLSTLFDNCYQKAREMATAETHLSRPTFPETSPYTLAETLQFDFWIDSPDIN